MATSLTNEFDNENLEVLDNNVTVNSTESGVQTTQTPHTNSATTLKHNNYTTITITIVIAFVGVVIVAILGIWCSTMGSSSCHTS